jgi:hypothetical protein
VSPQGDSGSELLFGDATIPVQYYRSCLMSPEFFPVINSQLAGLVSKQGVSRAIRTRVISFLKKLID